MGAFSTLVRASTGGGSTDLSGVETEIAAVVADLATHEADVANPHAVTKTQVGLSNVDNTSDVNKPVSTAQATADALAQPLTGKDATGGYAGLTLFKINFKNAANTFTNFLANATTAARTYTFPDRSMTVAGTDDITGTNSGTNTGDQTITLTGGVTGSGTGSFAATVVTNANLTGPITSTGNATAIASQTGTGTKFVMDTSPTLVTPDIGTPSAGVATNLTGTASGLTAGNVTTNANLTGEVTSVGNAATVTNAAVIAKVLTGYSSAAGTVASTDSLLQAIQKLNGNALLKAPLASPALTGTPTAPTAAVDTNTTQVATTAMVLAQAASATPVMDGVAAVGTSTRFARGDHVHASDTSKASLAGTTAFTAAQTINLNSGALPTPVTNTALQIGGADSTGVLLSADTFGQAFQVIGRRAGGTNASKSATLANTALILVGGYGYGTTAYSSVTRVTMNMHASENWTDTAQGTKIVFETTPNGSTSRAAGLTIDQDKTVICAGAATVATTLGVTGATTLSTTLGVTGAATLSSTLAVTGNATINQNAAAAPTPPTGNILQIVGADAAVPGITLDCLGTGNPIFYGRRANGTAASPTAITSNNILFQFQARGYGATAYGTTAAASIRFIAAENWTDTAQGCKIAFVANGNGTVSQNTILTLDQDKSVTSGGTLVAATTIKAGSYTVATLPTPSTGLWCYVTDALAPTYGVTVTGGGAVVTPVFYNGANWTCR